MVVRTIPRSVEEMVDMTQKLVEAVPLFRQYYESPHFRAFATSFYEARERGLKPHDAYLHAIYETGGEPSTQDV